MNLDIGEVAKVFGAGVALSMVVAAAAYTAVKVLRSDRTLTDVIERIESERDYYRAELDRERTDSKREREELRAMLERQGEDAKNEREGLSRQIEDLRRALQHYTLRKDQQ